LRNHETQLPVAMLASTAAATAATPMSWRCMVAGTAAASRTIPTGRVRDTRLKVA